jgi:putative sterol carrier protein
MTAKEFLYSLKETVQPESIQDKETCFHFQLDGEGGGDFTVNITDGKLQLVEGFQGESKCTVKATSDNFMKVISGELKPLNALLFGKVKVSNQGELIKYAKVFGLMK